MIRNVLKLGVALVGLWAVPVAAQDGSVVGGAVARLVGGGDNAEVVVEQVTAWQPSRMARIAWGNGTGTAVQYMDPVPSALAGRVARMSGGGEDTQVTYTAPAEPPASAIAKRGAAVSPRG